MQKKRLLIISFTLAAVLVMGPLAFSVGATEDNSGMGNMMNGNGMNGMMNMMENGNMDKMMEAMNSEAGQEMMNSCSNFMSSYDETEDEEDNNAEETDA
jgi:hypothetical protein